MEEETPETREKTWNQEFAEWMRNSGKTVSQIRSESGIADSTLRDYLSGKVSDLDKLKPENRDALYKLTGLDFFKLSDESILYKRLKERERTDRRDNLTIEDKILNAEYAFRVLCYALEELRNYPEAREELAKKIKQPIVGRLTSYLEGMYTDNKVIVPMIPRLIQDEGDKK